MRFTVDEFIRRLNEAPDIEPKFVGTYHITDDIGEYVNNPHVRFCVMSCDRPVRILDARKDCDG